MSVILHGDSLEVLKTLESGSVDCCVTSPPYWGLRDYGVEGQLGLEKSPESYVENMVKIFSEVKRVLKDDGTLWLNLGDSYATSGGCDSKKVGGFTGARVRRGSPNDSAQDRKSKPVPAGLKQKDLVGIPWRVAFALQSDGWYLRQDIIWHKPNPMPESVRDRCTKAHEYIFLLSKNQKYFYDVEAIKEPVAASSAARYKYGMNDIKTGTVGHLRRGKEFGLKGQKIPQVLKQNPGKRIKRSVWTVTTKPFKGAHFATFPPDLIEPCILAGCREGGVVLDPFFGAGTTGIVSIKHKRSFIGIELNEEYIEIAKKRLASV